MKALNLNIDTIQKACNRACFMGGCVKNDILHRFDADKFIKSANIATNPFALRTTAVVNGQAKNKINSESLDNALRHFVGEPEKPIKKSSIHGSHPICSALQAFYFKNIEISNIAAKEDYLIVNFSYFNNAKEPTRLCISLSEICNSRLVFEKIKKCIGFSEEDFKAIEEVLKQDTKLSKKILEKFEKQGNERAKEILALCRNDETKYVNLTLDFLKNLDLNEKECEILYNSSERLSGNQPNLLFKIKEVLTNNLNFRKAIADFQSSEACAPKIHPLYKELVSDWENRNIKIIEAKKMEGFSKDFVEVKLKEVVEEEGQRIEKITTQKIRLTRQTMYGQLLPYGFEERLLKMCENDDAKKAFININYEDLSFDEFFRAFEEENVGEILDIRQDRINANIYELSYILKGNPKPQTKTVILQEALSDETIEKLANIKIEQRRLLPDEKATPEEIKALFESSPKMYTTEEIKELAKDALENAVIVNGGDSNGKVKMIGQSGNILFEAWARQNNGEFVIESFYPILSGAKSHIDAIRYLYKNGDFFEYPRVSLFFNHNQRNVSKLS